MKTFLSNPCARFFVAIFLAVLTCSGTVLAADSESSDSRYAELLKRYVTQGGVRYAEWKANPSDLKDLVEITEAIAETKVDAMSKDEKLAFYINAYNAWMLRLVLEHYPIQSIRDIAPDFGVFTEERIQVAGVKMSLNQLEKEVIIKEFQEPRIHFAINCASRSCPPLMNAPFQTAELETQLDTVARAFANTTDAVVLDSANKTARLSSIFDWYASDFKAAGGPVIFLNKYRASPIPADDKITFQAYDWNLNLAP